jgi:two-component system sensor histidine kinase KdpD
MVAMMLADVGRGGVKILCGFRNGRVKECGESAVHPIDAAPLEAHLSGMDRDLSSPASRGAPPYALALLMVAVSTLAGLAIAPRWGNSAVDLLYLPAVLAAAVLGGLGPALLAAVGSALAYNFFFTAPYHTFRIHSPADVVTVVVLFLAAAITSHLAASIRRQARLASAHAARNATIAGLARRLLSCTSEQQIAEVGVGELAALFDCNAVMLAGQPEPHVVAAEPATVRLNPSDLAAAAQVMASGRPAGRGITRVTTVEWQIHPVSAGSGPMAVLALARDDGVPPAIADQSSLLQSLLDQLALALERARLEGEAREFAALRDRDRFRTGLLSSIGRDLDPPLTAIAGAVGQLRRTGEGDKSLLSGLTAEVARLQRYLANLLDLGVEADDGPVEAGGVSIDLARRAVTRDGKPIHLTPKEFAVLAELAKYPGRVLSHAHLLKAAWGPAQERQTEYLRVAIRGLRQKLEIDPARPALILNEPAVGYRLLA